jgi:uncharacterized membrane protein YdbT with pleckstrin-like domain
MPFPAKKLNDGEYFMLDVHPHWWFYGPDALFLLGTFICAAFIVGKTSGTLETSAIYVGVGASIVAGARLIVKVVKWRTTYFVVTNHRLIDRQGVVARSGVEIPIKSVDNVNFSQTLFERFAGLGKILIESGGKKGQQVIPYVARPEEVQKVIHEAIHEAIQQSRGRENFESAPSFPGVASELERLEALWERGTLTDEEFEAQKRRLLD